MSIEHSDDRGPAPAGFYMGPDEIAHYQGILNRIREPSDEAMAWARARTRALGLLPEPPRS